MLLTYVILIYNDWSSCNKYLYNDQVGKKLVEDFYQLLVVYSQNEKIKPVESYLLKLNDIARKKKTRLVYYDNHSLKEDLSQFIVEEYRLSKMEQKWDKFET